MEVRIGKYDIFFSWSRYWKVGFDKCVGDNVTYRDLSLGFLFIGIDTYNDYLIY